MHGPVDVKNAPYKTCFSSTHEECPLQYQLPWMFPVNSLILIVPLQVTRTQTEKYMLEENKSPQKGGGGAVEVTKI